LSAMADGFENFSLNILITRHHLINLSGQKMKKITTLEMEIAISELFNPRVNTIVPNVYWSFFRHEVDILVVTKAGYGNEIEIKISKADLKKDADKWHNHFDHKIKNLWFAVPDYLKDCWDMIPQRAGIIEVRKADQDLKCRALKKRNPKPNGDYRFSDKEVHQLQRLGSLRIWTLKKQIIRSKK
jgi:hypothetical protein